MAAATGTILNVMGTTTPFYDYFTLVNMNTLNWYYDNAPVTAGNFIPGMFYTIATVGTTDFTLIGSPNNTIGTTFTCSGTPAYGFMGVGTGTGTATIAGGVRMGQLLPPSGLTTVSFNGFPTTVEFGGQITTAGSPNVTQEFLVQFLYIAGAGPDLTQTIEFWRQQARNACNNTYLLAMT